MTKRRTYNTNPPAVHPKPFQSALWNHLEEIRQMRRARKMWIEIAAHLKEAHGLEVSYRTIRNFFIRTRSPNGVSLPGLKKALAHNPCRIPARSRDQPCRRPPRNRFRSLEIPSSF